MAWSVRLVAIAVLIGALEYLATWRSLLVPVPARVLPWIGLQGSAALYVISVAPGHVSFGPTILFVTSVIVGYCVPYGRDAADQMATVVLLGSAAAAVAGTGDAVAAFHWFITAQACVAYVTAGLAKLGSPIWRAGDAVGKLLSTDMFGRRSWGHWIRQNRWICRSLTYFTIVYECLFPLVLTRVPIVVGAILVTGLIFHVATAFLMRLNTFPWAFCATYPGILYCCSLG